MTDKEIAKHLAEFFEDEPEKITLWWFTKNGMIGGIEPAWLRLMRPEKFREWIKNLKDGNIA